MNRNLKQYIRYNRDALLNSQKQMKDIFEIMFRQGENILCEGHDGFRVYRYTYAQMHSRICKTAAGLYEKLGAKGAYIALELDNSPEWIMGFWGILMSGNKPYLVNLRYPKSLSDGILKTLNIRYSLCTGETGLEAEALDIRALEKSTGTVPETVFADEIAFSSSATSMNEVICFYTGAQVSAQILNFQGIVRECPRIAKHYKGELKQLAFLPFYHVFGLFAVYFWFTFFGRTLVFLKDYSADTILKTVRRHRVTHIFAVPMLWHTVEKQLLATVREQGKEEKLQKGLALMTRLQNSFPGIGPEIAKWVLREVTGQLFGPSVLFCINGGSYLRDSAMALFNGLGYCMHNGYGMSEIGITSVELRKQPRHRNLNSIGHPFDTVQYRLDEQGCLLVKSDFLCTRKLVGGVEHPTPEWFATGDLMHEQDGHYFIHGRQSDVVIGENGENINPVTVESLFLVGKAKMLCVLGLPGQNGQELSMVVQLSPYASESTICAIREEVYGINATLPTATAIRKFYFTTDDLAPPTAVKVSRKQLLTKINGGQVTLTPFAQMRSAEGSDDNSPLMLQVRSIIAKVLELPIEQVTPTSHIFFDLGGTSIQYFSILTALAEHFSLSDYDKNDTYRYTPKEICQYIESRL